MASNESPKALGDQPAAPFSQTTESFHAAYTYHRGLTKREFFAGMALMGAPGDSDTDATAQRALEAADALLAKLAQRQGGGL